MFDPITKELMPGQLPTAVTAEDRERAASLPIGQREGADLFQPEPEPKKRGRKKE